MCRRSNFLYSPQWILEGVDQTSTANINEYPPYIRSRSTPPTKTDRHGAANLLKEQGKEAVCDVLVKRMVGAAFRMTEEAAVKAVTREV